MDKYTAQTQSNKHIGTYDPYRARPKPDHLGTAQKGDYLKDRVPFVYSQSRKAMGSAEKP